MDKIMELLGDTARSRFLRKPVTPTTIVKTIQQVLKDEQHK